MTKFKQAKARFNMNNKTFTYIALLLCLLISSLPTQAQRHEIISPRIASLQVVAGSNWLGLPITTLQGDAINIDFDDMTHDYHRYTYKLEHCDANWDVTTGLFETDYMQGFNGELKIEQIEQSLNTNHLYTHYHLAIPNDNCRIKMSGNYKLTVYDDDADEAMFSAYFMIFEPEMKVGISYTSNTDIDINRSHQQVTLLVDYRNIHVNNPQAQLTTVVMQNGRWDNAVVNPKPDYQHYTGMEWRHNKQLIFWAGNEYRKFEMLDMDHPTMGIDDIKWDGKEYHAFVMTDQPRPNYVYDESAKGSFYIRNSDNTDIHTTSEYAQVHFTLQAPRQNGEVYLNGDWTCDRFQPKYRMDYDAATHSYHASVLLKQGYYSYQYLVLKDNGETEHVSTEGDYYQTANRYDALIYYRGNGDRSDRLVGWGTVK